MESVPGTAARPAGAARRRFSRMSHFWTKVQTDRFVARSTVIVPRPSKSNVKHHPNVVAGERLDGLQFLFLGIRKEKADFH